MLLKLAFRNIQRNFRRSLITVLAIAVGLSVLILSLTLRTGQYKQMIDSGVSQIAGHVVVQDPAWQVERKAEQVVDGQAALVKVLSERFPSAVITSRSFFGGLLASSSGPTFASLVAFEPETEAKISDFKEMLVEGEWINDSKGVLIGASLAEKLDVSLGDKLVFTGQFGAEMSSKLFRVTGIFKTGVDEMDSFTAFVHIEAAQELMQKPDSVHQLALHFDNVKIGERNVGAIREIVTNASPESAVLPWQEALPEIVKMVEIDVMSNEVINAVLLIIVGMGVLNTMLMSVLERIREFGVLLALGLTPGKLARLVLMEGMVLGVIGAVVGLLLGTAISYPMITHGIDLSAQMGTNSDVAGAVVSSVMKGIYDWPRMGLYALLVIVLSVLSAIYPALKLMSMKPVEAMRHQ